MLLIDEIIARDQKAALKKAISDLDIVSKKLSSKRTTPAEIEKQLQSFRAQLAPYVIAQMRSPSVPEKMKKVLAEKLNSVDQKIIAIQLDKVSNNLSSR